MTRSTSNAERVRPGCTPTSCHPVEEGSREGVEKTEVSGGCLIQEEERDREKGRVRVKFTFEGTESGVTHRPG